MAERNLRRVYDRGLAQAPTARRRSLSAICEMVDVGYRYTQERLLPWLEGNLRVQRHDESPEIPREGMPG